MNVFCAVLRSVVDSDDSPMQVEKIDDPTVTHLTLKGLDRHSHYRFYLRGHTNAGDGEPIMKKGATTLDGGTEADLQHFHLHRSDEQKL